MDAVTVDEVLDTAEPKPAARAAVSSPRDGGKWPLATRVVFIAGSAAALWGLIFLGYRTL